MMHNSDDNTNHQFNNDTSNGTALNSSPASPNPESDSNSRAYTPNVDSSKPSPKASEVVSNNADEAKLMLSPPELSMRISREDIGNMMVEDYDRRQTEFPGHDQTSHEIHHIDSTGSNHQCDGNIWPSALSTGIFSDQHFSKVELKEQPPNDSNSTLPSVSESGLALLSQYAHLALVSFLHLWLKASLRVSVKLKSIPASRELQQEKGHSPITKTPADAENSDITNWPPPLNALAYVAESLLSDKHDASKASSQNSASPELAHAKVPEINVLPSPVPETAEPSGPMPKKVCVRPSRGGMAASSGSGPVTAKRKRKYPLNLHPLHIDTQAFGASTPGGQTNTPTTAQSATPNGTVNPMLLTAGVWPRPIITNQLAGQMITSNPTTPATSAIASPIMGPTLTLPGQLPSAQPQSNTWIPINSVAGAPTGFLPYTMPVTFQHNGFPQTIQVPVPGPFFPPHFAFPAAAAGNPAQFQQQFHSQAMGGIPGAFPIGFGGVGLPIGMWGPHQAAIAAAAAAAAAAQASGNQR
ncbi:hypothetical protein HDU76_001435, partial [Blyttiomyces sp. JEL0837]